VSLEFVRIIFHFFLVTESIIDQNIQRFLTIVGFLQDESIDDVLFDQLEKAMADARNARQDAFQETINRGKAEKDAIGAIRRVNLL
jgi:hypothetical protein